jgi:uncharacterized membrane protein YeaQ/YmgE (transglycosylase-associated protein family)
MDVIINWIISLISGAVGGNIGGAAVSEKNLGAIANTIIGLLGGVGGDFILKALGVLGSAGAATAATGAAAATGTDLDLTSILANIGVSGVSGGVLTAVIALIKDALQKK